MKTYKHTYELTAEQMEHLRETSALILAVSEKERTLKQALHDYTETYRLLLDYLLKTPTHERKNDL